MNNHTPGQWKYFKNYDGTFSVIPLGNANFEAGFATNLIAKVFSDGIIDPEANARLIASAPEIFQALHFETEALTATRELMRSSHFTRLKLVELFRGWDKQNSIKYLNDEIDFINALTEYLKDHAGRSFASREIEFFLDPCDRAKWDEAMNEIYNEPEAESPENFITKIHIDIISGYHQIGTRRLRTPDDRQFYEISLHKVGVKESEVIGYAFTGKISRIFARSCKMYRLLKDLLTFTEGNKKMSEINKEISSLIAELEGRDQEAQS